MSDTYTQEEFANSFSRRGYGRKKNAMKWLEEQGMAAATEDDFERCYHALNAPKITSRRSVLYGDGQNPSDPQHAPNSRGKSFNAQMFEAQREIDATDRWVRRRKEMEADA